MRNLKKAFLKNGFIDFSFYFQCIQEESRALSEPLSPEMSLRIRSFTGHSRGLTLRPNGAIRRANLNTRARTDAPSLTISGGSWRATVQKWPRREALFTERKSLFPVCNKTQTPGECQGAARLFYTSSSSESRHDQMGDIPGLDNTRIRSGAAMRKTGHAFYARRPQEHVCTLKERRCVIGIWHILEELLLV